MKKNDIILWKNKFNWILSLNGFVNIIVHPDYVFDGNFLKLYCELLEYVTSQKDVWIALPLQIAQWWKDRNNSSIELVGGEPFIRGPAKERGKAVVLSNQVWSNVSYR